MNNNSWDIWDESIHSKPVQVSKQKKAATSDCKPVFFDSKNNCGSFIGSKPGKSYSTSLIDCTCVSFAREKKPCKHMYRLAHELGVYALPYGVSYGLRKVEVVESFKKLTPNTAEFYISHFLFVHKGKFVKIKKIYSAELQELINAQYLTETPNSLNEKKSYIDVLNRDSLYTLASQLDTCPGKSTRKNDLKKYLLKNISEINFSNLESDYFYASLLYDYNEFSYSIRSLYHKMYH